MALQILSTAAFAWHGSEPSAHRGQQRRARVGSGAAHCGCWQPVPPLPLPPRISRRPSWLLAAKHVAGCLGRLVCARARYGRGRLLQLPGGWLTIRRDVLPARCATPCSD